MGVDRKYGRVTVEHERRLPIGDSEPVFLFRAKDKQLPELLTAYYRLCQAGGSPQEHLDGIAEARDEIREWQDTYGVLVPGGS